MTVSALTFDEGAQNMPRLDANDEITLERLIDKSSLFDVLVAVATIASDKGAFIRHAWQDDNTARVWDKAHNHIVRAADRIHI